MATSVLKVEGISCQHCVQAVSNAVSALPGVNSVNVDLPAKTVTVAYESADLAGIRAAIQDQGYDVVD